MRIVTAVAAAACAAALTAGCGWRMAESPIRVSGRVIDAGSKEPVPGACIDIADEREKLEFALNTGVLTNKSGFFDTVYRHTYDRWTWLGVPVWWLPTVPERIYVEVLGEGYRPRITSVEYRATLTGTEKEPPPVALDSIAIHRRAAAGKRARAGETE
ncbi:MAG TPA: hypothetical protein PK696_08300 [bacterium]|nr:carboxypeptidase-like regulatory domain-containing protein [Chlamydiota bacterium]HOE27674.1 hypothetical protein [bacterium]HQM52928.1 hypothetical protein [bacterium]